MLTVAEAGAILARETAPLEPVCVELAHARGCALAECIVADCDFPPTDRSAMDGWAVRAADLPEPGRQLRVAGELRAGAAPGTLRVEQGTAVRIFTGAIVPPGADAVVMVERTSEDRSAGRVRIDTVVRAGDHIRRAGSERRRGEPVLEPGTPIDAAEIAALAALGQVRPRVHRRPRVAVLSTGDEVIAADRAPEPHQVRNSNAHALLTQLAGMGLAGVDLGIAADAPEELGQALRAGVEADVLLVTGGVSVGAYDLVGSTLESVGMRVLFHRVAVKPGKPVLAGRVGDCLVFGLPGNPVSVFTAFLLFVAPALRRLLGYRVWEHPRLEAVLDQPLRTRPGRETYHLARIDFRDGQLRAAPVPSTGSGDVLSLSRANGYVVTPAEVGEAPAGARLEALRYR